MTDRNRPRLLAVSQIPPDLRAALTQRYGLADHPGGAAPGYDVAVTMSGAQAADDAKDPNMDPNKYPSWKENYFVSADGHLMPAKKDQPPPDLRYFKPTQK